CRAGGRPARPAASRLALLLSGVVSVPWMSLGVVIRRGTRPRLMLVALGLMLTWVLAATMVLSRVRLKVLAITEPGGLKLMPPPVDGLSARKFGDGCAPGVYNPDTALLKAIV